MVFNSRGKVKAAPTGAIQHLLTLKKRCGYFENNFFWNSVLSSGSLGFDEFDKFHQLLKM